jgi:hypothetical protein
MDPEDLRKLARNALAEPFRIRMTGGEIFEVRHHDFITVSDYHAVIVLPDEKGKYRANLAAIMNISTIEMLPTSMEVSSSTNGKSE